jgi:hypothetical protein
MEGPGQVPPVLMLFTGLVCMGVMVNVTVVIPTASLVGSSLLDAALVSWCGESLGIARKRRDLGEPTNQYPHGGAREQASSPQKIGTGSTKVVASS